MRANVLLWLVAGSVTVGCQGSLGMDPPPARGGNGQATPTPPATPPGPSTNVSLPPPGPPQAPPPAVTNPPPVAPPPAVTPPVETPDPTPAPPVVVNPPAPPPPAPPVTPEPPAAPPPPAQPPRPRLALLVVADANNLGNGDEELADILDQLDFTVITADDNDDIDDAPAAGLVVISQSANANQVAGEYRNFASPVVVMNSALFDDMRMTNNGQNINGTTNAREVEIRKPEHPLAAGLTGRVLISSQNTALHWGVPNANAVVVVTLPNDAMRATVFGYEQGASMQGLNAAARRVGFFAGNAVTDRLNLEGQKLFEAAATWAWSR